MSTMSQPSFPILLFTQLARRLQHSNARYNQIAYQCRHTQRPTHHAKQRAYRVGLWIDTSRARPDTAASTVLDRTACSPVWGATETETGREEDAYLPNPWPEMPMKSLPRTVVVHKRPVTPSLSPLELGLSNIDDVDACDGSFRGPVPGAPRWRSRPLPKDDSDCKMQAVTNERVSFKASCTYDAVLRDVITRHASDSLDAVKGGLGIMAPPCHKKRKLWEDDVDGSVMISRRPRVGVPNGCYFLGPRWSERPRGGL